MATHLTGHPSAGPLSGTYELGVAGLGDTAIAGNNAYNDKFNDNGKGSEGNGQTTLDNFVDKNISGPLSETLNALSDVIINSLPFKTIEAIFGSASKHPGKTSWEAERDSFSDLEAQKNWLASNPQPKFDQFTYQNTDAEKKYYADRNKENLFNSKPDGINAADWANMDSATKEFFASKGQGNNQSNVVTRTDSEGNTREVGQYTNNTPQRGSNTAVYGDNYLKAIPDSYKINNLYKQILGREAGPAGLNFYGPKFADGSMSEPQLKATLLASNEYKNSGGSVSAPLSAPITSPSASNSVATSYGNSSNAGRQWTSGVFANNNGGGYTGGGDTEVDTTKNGTTLNGLYQEVFGRDVGPDGIAAYQSALDNKTMTPEQVRAILMTSAEKTNQLATGNTAAVVTAPLDVNDSVSLSTTTNDANTAALKARMNQSYIDNFGRPIGDAGMDHYLPMLQSGMHTNGQAIDEAWFNSHLAKSDEAKTYTPLGGFAETGMLSTNLGYTPVNAMTTAAAAATTAGAA